MALLGCAQPKPSPIRLYGSPPPEIDAQRIVVAPFLYGHRDERVSREITEAFIIELQKLGRFEIISPYTVAGQAAAEGELWRDGVVDLPTMVKLRRRLKAEAFVFGTITHYKPYRPPILGVKVSMVSARTGAVVWAAEAVFDASNVATEEHVKAYYDGTSDVEGEHLGWKVVLLSMRRYAHFVSHQLLSQLRS